MKNNNLIKLKRYVKYIIKKTYREEIERMQKENSIEELNDIQQATKDILILRRLNTKVGTFSDYIIFLKSIEYAIEVGKIPIVDRQTLKNDFMPAPDNINAWELFFEQPLGYGLSNIDYDTMSVSVCYNGGGMFPVSIMKCADENVVAYWRNIARKYIRLNENMRTYVEDKYTELLDGKRVLGVSVREGYQKLAEVQPDGIWGHPIQTPIEQLVNDVKKYMKEWKVDTVFFTCQTNETVKTFCEAFGEKACYLKRTRSNYKDLQEGKREIGKLSYEKAFINEKDYITEIFLLSKCNCFICSENSGSEAAFIMSSGFEHFICYENGIYK